MENNIMFYPAIVLMIVEAAAVVFLITEWRKAKREHREYVAKNPPFARELMPMGAVTYAIACSHCKNRGPKGNDKAAADRCHKCRCGRESVFEIDPATFMEWIPVTERLPSFDTERVLVMTKGDMILGYPKMDTDRYMNGRWVRYGDCVTHWMPLPEPPKEVE